MDIVESMKKSAVVLQKPSLTIAVRADLSAVQRKFYNVMLFFARQELKKDKTERRFTIPFLWFKEILSSKEIGKNKNDSYYIQKLKEVKRKDIEYDILNKERGVRLTGLVSLVAALHIEEKLKNNEIRKVSFELPESIIDLILDPKGAYAKINLVVIKGLSSKYSIILYELAKDYENVEIPEMTIEDFRKIFNIEGKYPKMPDLKKYVLGAAVNDLNNNPNIDFLINYELRKTGPKYTHIKFHVKPKSAKLKLDQQKDKIITQEIQENPDISSLLALVPEEYRAKKNLVNIVLGGLEEKDKEYMQAQIEYTNKNAKKNYIAFLKDAIEGDYAGYEQVEIKEMPVEEDTIEVLNEKYAGRAFYRNGTIYRIIEFIERDGKIVLIAEKPNGTKVLIANKSDNVTSEFVEHALGLMEEESG